jgi:hypothetical protein
VLRQDPGEASFLGRHERPQARLHLAKQRLGPVPLDQVGDERAVASLGTRRGEPRLEARLVVDGDLDPAEERADVLRRLVPAL